MTKLPKLVALVLCNELRVDPVKGETSLGGLFHARFVQSFPSPPQVFTVYVALNGGIGEGIMQLVVTCLETEKDVYSYKKWFIASGPDSVVNVEIKIRKCRFPVPGRYGFSLRFDDEEVTHRTLQVFQA
jgi:hypothetical protein